MEYAPNSELVFGGVASYKQVLENLGVAELIRLDKEDYRSGLLREYITKAVFYSKGGPEAHNKTDISLIYDQRYVTKEGSLGDFVLIAQIQNVMRRLKEIDEGHISVNSVISLRAELIDNLFGNSKYLEGLRRYRNSVGPYITIPAEMVEQEFGQVVSLLNSRHINVLDSFMTNVEFLSGFIKIHPFEDSDGRVARILYNNYAIKNGFRGMHITEELRQVHEAYLHPYFLTGSISSAIAGTLLLSLSPSRLEKLLENIDKTETESVQMLEIKDLIKLYMGKISPEMLKTDIEFLYLSGQKDPNPRYSAIWMAGYARLDSPVIMKAYYEEDSNSRIIAVHSMGLVDYKKYRNLIRNAALKDPDEGVRTQAVVQIAKNKDLDRQMAIDLITGRNGKGVLIALGKFYTFMPSDGETSWIPAQVLSINEDLDIRLRGYQSLVVHSDLESLHELVSRSLVHEGDLVKKEVVVELKRQGRLNLDEIADALSRQARTDGAVRMPLLGELVIMSEVNEKYVSLFKEIITAKSGYSDSERAHAIYLLGREKGSDDLYEYVKGDSKRSQLENAAILLAYEETLGRAYRGDIDRPRIDMVEIAGSGSDLVLRGLMALIIQKHSRGGGANLIEDEPTRNNGEFAGLVRGNESTSDRNSIFAEIVSMNNAKYGDIFDPIRMLAFNGNGAKPLLTVVRGEAQKESKPQNPVNKLKS